VAQRVGGRDPQDALGTLARHWGWVFFFGAVMVVAGILAVAWPGRTLVVLAVVFGVQLIFDGIYRLVAAVAAPLESGGMRVLLAFLGILSIIVGLWAVRHVLITILSLTLFLGVYWVVHGLVIIFRSDFSSRHARQGSQYCDRPVRHSRRTNYLRVAGEIAAGSGAGARLLAHCLRRFPNLHCPSTTKGRCCGRPRRGAAGGRVSARISSACIAGLDFVT
jgi:uncharacterized membrane protein HdeD (DUF308 family)